MSTGIKFHTEGAAERKAREPIYTYTYHIYIYIYIYISLYIYNYIYIYIYIYIYNLKYTEYQSFIEHFMQVFNYCQEDRFAVIILI